jgi:hypothetical protein
MAMCLRKRLVCRSALFSKKTDRLRVCVCGDLNKHPLQPLQRHGDSVPAGSNIALPSLWCHRKLPIFLCFLLGSPELFCISIT